MSCACGSPERRFTPEYHLIDHQPSVCIRGPKHQIKYVYVAGPLSSPEPIGNTAAAVSTAEYLSMHGVIPFVPHLLSFWHYLYPHDYEFWMRQDEAWLDKCDAVLRMPGASPGADREVDHALNVLKIPVFHKAVDLLKAAGKV